MANNRMFLVHVPTGLAVMLGKRLAWGWYLTDETQTQMGARVEALFDALEKVHYAGNQDDFALAMEDVSETTLALGRWKYGPKRSDDLVQLVMEKTP